MLEKPTELLLQHREIDISFCFSWANESWKRTWSDIDKGNVWCDTFDPDNKKGGIDERGLLVKQRYGREEEWKRHIEYLIPFFLDQRYLKVAGKPVFVIYQSNDIFCMKAMMDVWQDKLTQCDMDGIYLIGGSYGKLYSENVDINYDHEPGASFVRCRENREYMKSPEGIELFDYERVWQHILNEMESSKLPCAFTGFDASPRKGYKSVIVNGNTPERFAYFFKRFLRRAVQNKNKIVFINAWNEWGEGMYLEPCQENKYGYLEAVQSAIRSLSNQAGFYNGSKTKQLEELIQNNKRMDSFQLDKSKRHILILSQWLSALRAGIRAEEFFNKYGYSTIAIYGMGILGW